ncbi:MAG: hypothetical protein HY689_08270 [Chloroflexi bacterium]|nr:hypothetical protein [Chloroflexota bacterium]
MKSWRDVVRLAALALVGAALAQELRKPQAERTWHGTVGGLVPYDFRPPTWERLRAAYWNPEDDRLLTPMPFGVGWAVNFGALRRWAMARP